MKRLLLIVFCLLLTACGDSNPLIGKWAGSVDISNPMIKQSLQAVGISTDMRLEFTDKELVITQGTKETRKAVRYRVEKDKVYITDDTGKTEKKETWELIPMKDKDTIEYPIIPGITATLKRAK